MIIEGHCPTLGKEHSIEIDYLDASTLSGKKRIKGRFTCSVVSSGGNCPIANECPINAKAPKETQ